MTEVLVFKFPTLNKDNHTIIERKYCELINDYHNGITLEPEVLDWLDGANNFLLTSKG